MEKKFIAIVGGIAVGKTTIGKKVCNTLNHTKFIEEDVSNNLFLSDFYSDMKKWAFHSRISTLSMILSNYTVEHNSVNYILMDRCLDELINFAELQYINGNLNDKEYSVYKSLYSSIIKLVHPIDKYIYCHCSPESSLERIKHRNRTFEQNINIKYINDLNKIYENWINSLEHSKVIRVNTDMAITDEKIKEIIEKIKQNSPEL